MAEIPKKTLTTAIEDTRIADIPLAENDKGDVIGWDGQQWRAPDSVAEHPSGRKAYQFGNKWQFGPEPNPILNTARIAGTAAVQGLTDVVRAPAALHEFGLEGMDYLMRKAGLVSDKPEDIARRREPNPLIPSVAKTVESIGLPTDPKAEAERLAADWTKNRAALAEGARVAGGSLVTGAGPVGALAAGAGAALGARTEIPGADLALSLTAPMLARKMITRATSTPTPSLEDLKTKMGSLYDASEKAGVVIKPVAYVREVSRISNVIGPKIVPELHPGTAATLKALEKRMGKTLTLREADELRQIIGGSMDEAARAGRTNDLRLLTAMKNRFSQWLDSRLDVSQTLAGDPVLGAKMLKDARSVASRYYKAKEIDDLIFNASTQAASPDLALRNKFGQLAREKGPEWRGYSRPEIDAVMGMTKPSGVRKAIRMAGYAPLFIPTYGETGKFIAQRAALSNAERVAEVLRRGGPLPLPSTPAGIPPATAQLIQALRGPQSGGQQ